MGNWIKAFKESAGVYYPLIGLVLAAIISRLDWTYHLYLQFSDRIIVDSLPIAESGKMIFGFPSWILGITFLGWWFFFFALSRVVKLNGQIKDARLNLSRLRHSGVNLRNTGRFEMHDANDWMKWKNEVEQWNENVKAQLRKINEADAEWFAVLDVVPPPREGMEYQLVVDSPRPPHGQDQQRLYQWHEFRVKRLGKMIYHLWGRN